MQNHILRLQLLIRVSVEFLAIGGKIDQTKTVGFQNTKDYPTDKCRRDRNKKL